MIWCLFKWYLENIHSSVYYCCKSVLNCAYIPQQAGIQIASSRLHFSEVDNTPIPEVNIAQLGKDQTQCAVCMNIMAKTNWFLHKQNSHNNLAWRVGDPPLVSFWVIPIDQGCPAASAPKAA